LDDHKDFEDVVADASQEPSSSDDPNSALSELFASLAKRNEEEDQAARLEEPQSENIPESFRADMTMAAAPAVDRHADVGNGTRTFDELPAGEPIAWQEPISVSEPLLDVQDPQSTSPPELEPDSELESVFNQLLDQTRIDEPESETEIEQAIEGQSVADVLARMQAAGALDSNFDAFEEPTEHYADENESIEETRSHDPQPVSSFEGDGDGDVNSYMNQLLQRLGTSRQKSQPTPSAELPQAVTVRSTAEEVAKVNTKPKPSNDVLSAEEFVPKQVAPERNSNLAAMRDIANQSTRAAVETSKVQRTKAKITALLGGLAIGISGAAFLYSLCHKIGDIFFLGAIASLLASGTCAYFLYDEKFGKKESQ
jgi:hypothetical protein